MRKDVQSQAEKLKRNHRVRRIWYKVVSVLVCLTVFVTTYTLILPAVTLESSSDEAILDDLYSNSRVLRCPLEVHKHTAECYSEDNAPICGYADFVVHMHNKSCYAADGSLMCELPQIDAHTHDISCYKAVKTPTDAEEADVTDAQEPICGMDEIILHTHSDDCYDENGALICGMLEIKEHVHSASCFKMAKIDLNDSYGGLDIKIQAKENSFPVSATPLTVSLGEPSADDLRVVESELNGRYNYTAVDIKIMSGEEQVQPTDSVTLSFTNIGGGIDAANAFVYHLEEDGSLKKLDSTSENGVITVEASHFSTYAVASPVNTTKVRSVIKKSPLRAPIPYSERLTDRSNDIGVFSEGYEDSPYTYDKTYNASANLWVSDGHNTDGGTVYIGKGALTGNDIKLWQAEQYWDGKAPFRITSAEGASGTVDFQNYNDFALEDNTSIVPNAAIKFDNVTLNYCRVNAASQVQNLYARGNKFVIGENVTTETGKTWKLYGGTEHNRDLSGIGRPDIITNVVVAGGSWGYVFGGGEGATGRGTQVTIRDGAVVENAYGGGERKGSVGVNEEPGTGDGINVYVEGGTVNNLFGGSAINGKALFASEGYALTINEDINIDITGGHVNKVVGGDDTTDTSTMDYSVMAQSPINGNVTINISGENSVDAVLGDTNRNAPANIADVRQVKGYTLLNVDASNSFDYFDNFDVVNIEGSGVVVSSEAKPGISFVDSNPTWWKSGSAYSNGYIGQIRVADGAKLVIDKGMAINSPYMYLDETSFVEPDKIIKASNNHDPYYLSHAWIGETSPERRSLSVVSIDGQGSGITAASGTSFNDETDVCGLRIYGNVQGQPGSDSSFNRDVPGYSTLEVKGPALYSTGTDYYYYIVADSSANNGLAFTEPEGASYIVCYRNLEGGKIGWYLRERPTVSIDNTLVRAGDADNGKTVMHITTNTFGYEWSDDIAKNAIDLNWTKTSGTNASSLAETDGGVTLAELAGIESDTSGRFENAVIDDVSGVKYLRSFDCVIDDSNPVDPIYYDADINYHVVSATRAEPYNDLRSANGADAVRCVYDFAGNDDLHGKDGYTDSVMVTSPYSVTPAGADKALLRVYMPYDVTGELGIEENDGKFAFSGEGPNEAYLVESTDVKNDYDTEGDEYAESHYAVTIGGDDLADGVFKELTDPVTKYECEVYSYKNITISDTTKNNADGLNLTLTLGSLKKGGNDIGSGRPQAVNEGELQIRTVPYKNTLIITKQVENEDTDKVFPFTVRFTDDDGDAVVVEASSVTGSASDVNIADDGTVSFKLKDGDSIRIANVPSGSHFDLEEIEHVGFTVAIKENDTPIVTQDSLTNARLDRNRTLVVVNSGGYVLPTTGGTTNYMYIILAAVLIAIPLIVGFILLRRVKVYSKRRVMSQPVYNN